MKTDSTREPRKRTPVSDLVFVGFHARIVALKKTNGKVVWIWKSPIEGSGYVALLVDGERLFASVDGYMFGLDACTGKPVWWNDLAGHGVGIPCLATTAGSTIEYSLKGKAGLFKPTKEVGKAISNVADIVG